MTMEQQADSSWATDAGWVDEILLAGRDDQVCFRVPGPIDRGELRRLVADRRERLTAAGLRPGGAAALRLPPSMAYVANLLAIWQLGAQAVLLDYRLTDHEVEQARQRLLPQVIVAPHRIAGGLRVFFEVEDTISSYDQEPVASEHAVVQLSSGSTGPSKVIGRTAADLIAEIRRYTQIDGVALPGERIILLPSMVHVLGLVGGLLYGLHAGVELVPPQRLTGDSILDAIASTDSPATVLGVPFHISLLSSTTPARPPRQLRRMITGGELVPAATAAGFVDRFGVPLGNMYGMTEVGVIGTDLDGSHRPSVRPAPGITVRARDGELQIARAASPYLGQAVSDRWADGWLRTRDAGTVDEATGLVTILGRLDSQVTIGGLQVDLAEVEASIGALPGVVAAVVLFDEAITAYLQLEPGHPVEDVEARLATQLARYKQPQVYQVFDQFPRTTTGKLVRDRALLRERAA
ncbi:MAG TPA: long-chain fatty acid--CoA ligase [Jatrophihabitans sp.]|jgi:acyl-CoA synthetase (AMP-forming)/AMP-acid ligase II|uniref:class I adenylate-forming enzyme family protein n=1 Tax=Jatrophihabitans sp. TaxID=1932789 RepID=UPI002EDDB719